MTKILAVLGLALLALAQPVAAAAPVFPKLTGRVVDDAHLLTPPQVVDITSKSEALEAQSGAQLVVVTVPSLQGMRIEDYSYQLGRHWGIGEEKRDDGVILLVAPNDRKVWIATGYGARTRLTDAMASVIYRNAIIPKFRENPPDYGGGIIAGVDQIVTQMKLPAAEAQENAAKAEQVQRERRDDSPGFIPVIFWMFVIIFVFGSMARRVSGRRYSGKRYSEGRSGISPWVVLWGLNELSRGSRGSSWSGGSSWGGGGGSSWGGGGFSGGGGSFGGGGAGGSW